MQKQKWEYLIVEINTGRVSRINKVNISLTEREEESDYLQKMGDEGWELVSAIETYSHNQRLYFKRPKP